MDRIGKYEIVEALGMGGGTVVYRGIDTESNREVAIKIAGEKLVAHPPTRALFVESGRQVCGLDHPNLVRVYEVGDQEGTPYIVMEHFRSTSLGEHFRPGRELAVLEQLRIVKEVCQALGYLHRHAVLHLELNAGEVLLRENGQAKLLCNDIRSVAENGRLPEGCPILVGRNRHWAPEQWRGTKVDGRSDIFSAGLLLYRMLSGREPFDDYLVGDYLVKLVSKERHPSLASIGIDCPVALDDIMDRALAKEPGERYSTAEQMAADLADVISRME